MAMISRARSVRGGLFVTAPFDAEHVEESFRLPPSLGGPGGVPGGAPGGGPGGPGGRGGGPGGGLGGAPGGGLGGGPGGGLGGGPGGGLGGGGPGGGLGGGPGGGLGGGPGGGPGGGQLHLARLSIGVLSRHSDCAHAVGRRPNQMHPAAGPIGGGEPRRAIGP